MKASCSGQTQDIPQSGWHCRPATAMLEMQTESGKYEWHFTDSRHAYLVFGPSEDKQQVYKFTFDTPTRATGYLPDDGRPYTFKIDKPGLTIANGRATGTFPFNVGGGISRFWTRFERPNAF
jgi:hypothetical protein